MHHILYIHGFNSSPLSYKAQATQQYLSAYFSGAKVKVQYHCPQLDVSPKKAMAQLELLINSDNEQARWCLIGSSLGGYYASFLAEKYDLKAVLVNPAVKPYELLVDYIGEQETYHTAEKVIIKPSFMDELKEQEQQQITKKNYMVMLQTGDEVLDYQQAELEYAECKLIVEPGGDHSFTDFQQHLPNIMRFFELASE